MRTPTALAASLLVLAWLPSRADLAHAQCAAWNPGFGVPGPSNTVRALTVVDSGAGPALCAGGSFTSVEGVSANRIALWDGTTWSALGSGVAGSGLPVVNALAAYDDGSGAAVYAGGFFSSAGGLPASNIAKWNGTSWSALSSGVNGEVLALHVFDDGSGPKLYAGGVFTSAGGASASRIARWDGASWSSLGAGANGGVAALADFDDGSGRALYAGGTFTSAGGAAAQHIAKWNGASWSALGGGSNAAVLALAEFDDGTGPALFAGGYFSVAGGTSASNVAKWNGSSWSALGLGVDSDVNALSVYDDGEGAALYAGGLFGKAGGSDARRIAKWDGAAWSKLGAWPDAAGWPHSVNAFAVYGVGAKRKLCTGLSVVPMYFDTLRQYLACWDGAAWTPLGKAAGLNDSVAALAVCGDGARRELYAGGTFATAGSTSANRVAKWSGSAWSALGSGMNAEVSALAAFDDGGGKRPYAGGKFTLAGGVSASHVARWNGLGWSAVGGGVDGDVSALCVYDDGSGAALYAGGAFASAGGVLASNIARWDGSSWSALGSGVDGVVLALTVFDDGTGAALYAAGFFASAGGVSASRIARWNGAAWSALGSGVSGSHVQALCAHDDGTGQALYAGGNFTSAGGVSAHKLARWNGASWSKVGSTTPFSSISNVVSALASFDGGFGPALYVGDSSLTDINSTQLNRWDGIGWVMIGTLGVGEISALTGFDGNSGGGPDLYVGGWFHSQGSNLAQWLGCP